MDKLSRAEFAAMVFMLVSMLLADMAVAFNDGATWAWILNLLLAAVVTERYAFEWRKQMRK